MKKAERKSQEELLNIIDSTMGTPEQSAETADYSSALDIIDQTIEQGGGGEFASPDIQTGQYGVFDTGLDSDFNLNVGQLDDLEDVRARRQSGLELTGKAIGNVIVEAGATAVGSLGTLLDFEQHYNVLRGTEEEFTNWFTHGIEEAKKSLTQDNAGALRVFQTNEASGGFEPGDATWWAGNAGTLGTTLGIMLPAFLTGGIGGAVATGLGAGKTAIQVSQGLTAAIASRYMENTMEAGEITDRVFREQMELHGNEDVAREKAGEAGRNTFKANTALLPLDLIQYGLGFKAFRGLFGLAEKTAEKSAMSFAKNLGVQMASEGAEEGFQFISGEEAYSSAMKGTDFYGEGFGNRFSEYLKDDQFKTNVFFGALGGGVFSAAAPGLKAVANKISSMNRTVGDAYKEGDTETVQKAQDWVRGSAIQRDILKNGNAQMSRSIVEGMLKDESTTPEDRESLQQGLEDIDTLEKEWKSIDKLDMPEAAKQELFAHKWETISSGRLISTISDELAKMEGTFTKNKELTPELTQIKRLTEEYKAYKSLIKKRPELKRESDSISTKLEKAKREANELKTDGKYTWSKALTTSSDEIYSDKINKLVQEQVNLSDLKEKMKDLRSSKTAQDEAVKSQEEAVKKGEKEIKDIEKNTEEAKNLKNNFVATEDQPQIGDQVDYKGRKGKLKQILEDGTAMVETVTENGQKVNMRLTPDMAADMTKLESKEAAIDAKNAAAKQAAKAPKKEPSLEDVFGKAPQSSPLPSTKDLTSPFEEDKSPSIKDLPESFFRPPGVGNSGQSEPSLQDVFGQNPTHETQDSNQEKEVTEENKETTPMYRTDAVEAIAWASATDSQDFSPEMEALTEFLERNQNLAGHQVKLELDETQIPDSLKEKIAKKQQIKMEDIGSLPIKVVFYKDGQPVTSTKTGKSEPIYGFLHDDTWEGYNKAKKQEIQRLKKKIWNKIRKGEDVFTTITEKSSGTFSNTEGAKNNLADVLKKQAKDVKLFVRTHRKALAEGKLSAKKHKLAKVRDKQKGQPGAVYMEVDTFNGEKLPARVLYTPYSRAEAELIARVLQERFTEKDGRFGKGMADTISEDLQTYISQHEDGVVRGISDLFDLSKVTLQELTDFLVYDKVESSNPKTQLYVQNSKIYFGALGQNGNPQFIHTESIDEGSGLYEKFITFLTNDKPRTISIDHINKDGGKFNEYWINNNLLYTNLDSFSSGIPMVQPTVRFDTNLEVSDPVNDPATDQAPEPTLDQVFGDQAPPLMDIFKDVVDKAEFVEGESMSKELAQLFIPFKTNKAYKLSNVLKSLDDYTFDATTANAMRMFKASPLMQKYGDQIGVFSSTTRKMAANTGKAVKEYEDTIAYYNSKRKQIVFNTDTLNTISAQQFVTTMLHEVTHAATAEILHRYRTDGALTPQEYEFAHTVMSVYDELNLTEEEKQAHEIANEDEFVAEFTTSAKYREWVMNRLLRERPVKNRNLLERFVAWIRKMMGLNSEQDQFIFQKSTALDNAIEGIIKSDNSYTEVSTLEGYFLTKIDRPLNEFTEDQINEAVDVMRYIILKNTGAESFSNIDSLSTEGVKQHFEAMARPGNAFQQVVDNWDMFMNELVEDLVSAGIVTDTELNADEKAAGQSYKDAYTVNRREDAKSEIKLMVMSLPKITDFKDGTPQYEKGAWLGQPRFNHFQSAWFALEQVLGGTLPTATEPDVFKLMMDKVKAFTTYNPSFQTLVDMLESPKTPEYVRTRFAVAFQMNPIDFVTHTIEKRGENINYERIDSDTLSNRANVMSAWEEEFNTKFYKVEGKKITFNKAQADASRNLFNGARDVLIAKRNKGETVIGDKLVPRLVLALESIGVGMSPNTLIYAADRANPENAVEGLYEIVENNLYFLFNKAGGGNQANSLERLSEIKKHRKGDYLFNPIKGQNSESKLKELVNYELLFRENINDNTVAGPEFNKYWKFNLFDNVGQTLIKMKQGSAWAEQLANDPLFGNSEWMHWLAESGLNRDSVKLGTFLSYREKNSNHKGEGYASMSPVDERAYKMVNILNGIFPFLNLSDKSRSYEIKGMPFINNTLSMVNGEVDFMTDKGKETMNKIIAPFLDEMKMAELAYDKLFGEEPLSESKMIRNYHYVGDVRDADGMPTGNVFKSWMFPNIEPGSKDAIELGIYDENGRPDIHGQYEHTNADGTTEMKPDFYEKMYPYVNKWLSAQVNTAMNKAVEEKVFAVNNKGKIVNKVLPQSIMSKYNKNHKENALMGIISDITVNSIVANKEIERMFYGDVRAFKSMADAKTRFPGAAATKKLMRIHKDVPATYTRVVGVNVERASMLSSDEHIQAVADFTGQPLEEIQAIFKEYGSVNVTDAQGYITLKRFRDIYKGLAEWTDKHESAYKRLKTGSLLPEDLKLFKRLTMESIKGVHFGVQEFEGARLPIYTKYSQAVLYPGITKGTELDKLRVMMEKQKIDEYVVQDGSKGANYKPVNLYLDKFQEKVNPEVDLKASAMVLNNEDWGLQQDLHAKGVKPTLVGSQVVKNIPANIDLEADYNGRSGRELVQEVNNVVSGLSNKGKKKLFDKIGYNEVTKEYDESKLRTIFEQELISRGASKNAIEGVKAQMPFESMPQFRKQIQNLANAIINKATVQLKQLGGAFIQMSPMGITQANIQTKQITSKKDLADLGDLAKLQSRITWVKNPDSLKPPRIVGKTLMPGQILLPHHILRQVGGDVNKISPEVLQAIGYRIPNQANNSTDVLEIVGFLPEEMGDIIMSYEEITMKTGSDYDIDKMYLILPKYTFKDGVAVKVPYLNKDNSTLDERYNAYVEDIKKRSEVRKMIAAEGLDIAESEMDIFTLVRTDFAKLEANSDLMASLLNLDQETLVQDFLLEEEVIISKEEFEKLSIEEQNTEAALQNRRVELYQEILSHPSTYIEMMKPLESDALRDNIISLVGEEKIGNLDFHSFEGQFADKRNFNGGKFGVGQFANYLVDAAISHLSGKYLKVNLGIGHPTKDGKGTDLSQTHDVVRTKQYPNGRLISDVLSAYLSAFVDIKKDNYIVRGNINVDTSGTVGMLIRAGVPFEWVNAFISQPIIREYVHESQTMRGRTQETEYDNETNSVITALHVITSKYTEDGKPRSVESLPELDLSTVTTSSLANHSPSQQLGLLKKYVEFAEIAKGLGRSIQASKADTEGAGKNLTEAGYTAKLKDIVATEGIVGHWDEMFSNTMLGTFYKNSVELAKNMFRKTFMSETEGYQGMMNSMLKEIIGTEGSKLELETMEILGEEIYGALMSGSQLAVSPQELKEIVYGVDSEAKKQPSLAKRLKALKATKSTSKNNLLIQYLNYDIPRVGTKPPSVYISNTKETSKRIQNKLYRAWEELYFSDNLAEANFARDLAKMAYHTSAFRNNLKTYHKHLPVRILQDLGVDKYVNDIFAVLENRPELVDHIRHQIFQHNWKNANLVPKMDLKLKTGVPNVSMADAFAVDLNKATKFNIGKDSKNREVLRTYVKASYPAGKELDPRSGEATVRYADGLFQFVGYKEMPDAKGRNKVMGIYARINTLGYSESGTYLYEYNLFDSSKAESMIEENNITRTEEGKKFLKTITFAESVQDRKNEILNQDTFLTENDTNLGQEIKKHCKTAR